LRNIGSNKKKPRKSRGFASDDSAESEVVRGREPDVASGRRRQTGAPGTTARNRNIILLIEDVVDLQAEGEPFVQPVTGTDRIHILRL